MVSMNSISDRGYPWRGHLSKSTGLKTVPFVGNSTNHRAILIIYDNIWISCGILPLLWYPFQVDLLVYDLPGFREFRLPGPGTSLQWMFWIPCGSSSTVYLLQVELKFFLQFQVRFQALDSRDSIFSSALVCSVCFFPLSISATATQFLASSICVLEEATFHFTNILPPMLV